MQYDNEAEKVANDWDSGIFRISRKGTGKSPFPPLPAPLPLKVALL